MFKHIVAQGFYQMFWMFLFLYGLPRHMPQYAVNSDEDFLRVASVLFNTFIFAQVRVLPLCNVACCWSFLN